MDRMINYGCIQKHDSAEVRTHGGIRDHVPDTLSYFSTKKTDMVFSQNWEFATRIGDLTTRRCRSTGSK